MKFWYLLSQVMTLDGNGLRQPTVQSKSTMQKVSSNQVLRAAGSQSLDKMKEAISTGWSRSELDSMALNEGEKAVIHMAAWKGSLDILEYLVDEIKVNVDTIATGQYSYGKSAIFFACTRSRTEHVNFLLSRGASVKIVNNKGQSVLSLAASHFDSHMVDTIRKAEIEQDWRPWKNYRESHSDGLEYGDIDPRFLDRPLRPNDVVTDVAINPTTKATRQGGFLRRNPQMQTRSSEKKSKAPKTKKNQSFQGLTEEDQKQLQKQWSLFQSALCQSEINDASNLLLQILVLSDKQRKQWLPDTAGKLSTICQESSYSSKESQGDVLLDILNGMRPETPRQAELIEKVFGSLRGNESINAEMTTRTPRPKQSRQEKSRDFMESLTEGYWPSACRAVSELSLAAIARRKLSYPESLSVDGGVLCLPESPLFVDSVEMIEELDKKLKFIQIVGIDTEWARDADNSTVAATLQIAFQGKRQSGSSQLESYVLDLLKAQDDHEMMEKLGKLVETMFASILVLGFSVGNDVPKIELALQKDDKKFQLSRARILDLQLLWDRKQPPSLATISSELYQNCTLDKHEQLSDWSIRPLRQSQLDYAALDAAILLPLLAEKARAEGAIS